MEDMEKALGEVNWEEKLEGKKGVECWDVFKKILNEETERCIPKKQRRVGTKPVWMNNNTLRLIRKKRRLWKWYTREGGRDYESFQAYKNVQSLVQKSVKKARRNFEKKIAKDSNKKAFYSYLKKKTSNR